MSNEKTLRLVTPETEGAEASQRTEQETPLAVFKRLLPARYWLEGQWCKYESLVQAPNGKRVRIRIEAGYFGEVNATAEVFEAERGCWHEVDRLPAKYADSHTIHVHPQMVIGPNDLKVFMADAQTLLRTVALLFA